MRKIKQRDTVVLVAGGPAVDLNACLKLAAKFRTISNPLIIAADSGAKSVLESGWLPDLVVGDLDSIDRATLLSIRRNNIAPRTYHPDKDYTDLELAAELAAEYRPKTVIIASSFGGRFDHNLGNVQLLFSPLLINSYSLLTDGASAAFALSSPNRCKVEFKGLSGDSGLSLLPMSQTVTGVSISGTKWELESETLKLGRLLTVSNRIRSGVRSGKTTVSLRRGALLITIKPKPKGKK